MLVESNLHAAALPDHRPIRSFVRRCGPMGQTRRSALETLAPRYQIPYATDSLSRLTDHSFTQPRPLILEIGSGMGDTTALIAAQRPQHNFIACEIHLPGVAHLMQLLATQNSDNVKLIVHDACEVLQYMVADRSLSGVHIFFPDPWPKKRHHKRRLIQAPFVALLAQKIAPFGYVHCATDWPEYGAAMHAEFAANPAFSVTVCLTRPDQGPYARPETKFERRGRALGLPVIDLLIQRHA